MWALLSAGAAGGIVRGLVGYLKHYMAYKSVKFEIAYFLIVIIISSAAGLTVTWAITASGIQLPGIDSINPAIAFIVGYAGGDFLENVYKILVRKNSLFDISSVK